MSGIHLSARAIATTYAGIQAQRNLFDQFLEAGTGSSGESRPDHAVFGEFTEN